jgi:hypothetical protein
VRTIFTLGSRPDLTVPSSAQVIYPAPFQRQEADGGQPTHPRQALDGSVSTQAINAVLNNDPLAGMTPWQTYQRCIWISDEDTNTKISLLCLSRFMDKDLRAASMSYAQWARDCGFSERTAKRCAQTVANTWLRIGVGKGRYIPGKGHENRYDGVIPQKWADELRRRMRKGVEVKPDEDIIRAVDEVMSGKTGVSDRHPENSEVTHGHPEKPISGCQAGTGVSHSPARGVRESHVLQIPPEEERKRGADAPGLELEADATNGKGANPKRQRTLAKPQATTKEIDETLAAYNAAAAMHDFTPCRSLTDTRRKRLSTRLLEIGGVDAFKLALSAIPKNDFLMGRVPGRNGGAPFKLEIDRLLQTEGGLGDVLAKLIDAAGDDGGFDAEVQRLASTETGRAMIGDMGRDRALQEIRKEVLRRRGGANG